MTYRQRRLANVLIVDDEAIDQRLCLRAIERAGNVDQVQFCQSAKEALAYLSDPANPVPDTILVDINMPGLDGFDFVDRASTTKKNRLRDVPFVMLTTSMMDADLQRARSSSAIKGYLHKPLAPEHLHWLADLVSRQDQPQEFNLL